MARKLSTEIIDKIRDLINSGYTNPEIANELCISRNAVACYVHKNLGVNPNYQERIKKHSHLHETILKMRLSLSNEKIREKLNLTSTEMKSCLALAYRKNEFCHIRKDKRRRDSWSTKELKYLLKWSGIKSRKEINEHLKRGKNERVVKEKLQLLGLCSKNVNGLTLSQFVALFGKKPKTFIQTSAGSPASKFALYANWKIVTWIEIQKMLKTKYVDHSEAIKIYIDAMAMFQGWVWNGCN